jgi:hypothetical protein
MRVLYIEGVAIHGGPEPCVVGSRGSGRSVGRGRVGWVIEPRKFPEFGVPTPSKAAEGHVGGSVSASSRRTPRGQRAWARTKISMRENREIPRSPVRWSGRAVRGTLWR